jgi:hypothetical protein
MGLLSNWEFGTLHEDFLQHQSDATMTSAEVRGRIYDNCSTQLEESATEAQKLHGHIWEFGGDIATDMNLNLYGFTLDGEGDSQLQDLLEDFNDTSDNSIWPELPSDLYSESKVWNLELDMMVGLPNFPT